jgi:bacillopeptidase F
MIPSRLSRSQERKLTKKLFLAIAGSIGLVIFILIFGVKILINFSLFVDAIRGNSTQNTSQTTLLLPPILDPLPTATNSAVQSISGRGKAGYGPNLFVNGKEYRKIKIDDNGTFAVRDVTLKEGTNTLFAKLFDTQGNSSEPSATTSVTINKKEPTLEVTTPKDGETISGDTAIAVVSGKTDEENTVTVNGRIAVVGVNGVFSIRLTVNEGDNTITVVATNPAGNEKKSELKIKYQK